MPNWPAEVMTAIRLRRLWRKVRHDFHQAIRQLPRPPLQNSGDLCRLREWLDHNELGLALDELESLGNDNAITAEYWNRLAIAAARMGLGENYERFSLRSRLLDSIQTTLRQAGFRPRELLQFALSRHGWGDSDGGFGVTYPNDLDEHQREVEKIHIANGHVSICGHWGPPEGYEFDVPEANYVASLIRHLSSQLPKNDLLPLEALRHLLLTADQQKISTIRQTQ